MSAISRRRLLKTLAWGSSAALVSPHLLLAGPLQKKSRLGIALVGLGYYSTDLLAPALQQTKHCHLAGIVSGTPSKAEAWKKRHQIPDKNIYNYENFDQIANNPDIDVIYIVLPPSLHKEYVVRAAAAGKHVWCEKPMAVTEKECREMIDACKNNKVSLSIGYRLQHEPNTREYRRIVQQQLLGKVKHVQCTAAYRENRTDHWKQKLDMGGGVIYDMGVYPIQGARMGTGMEPTAVLSATNTVSRPDIYKNGLTETVVTKLEFPGGVTADIKTSFAENANFIHITCEKGVINMTPYSEYGGQKGGSPLGEIHTPYQVPFQQATQMDNEALAILQGKPALVPGEEGLRDIRIVEATLKSIQTGRQVKL